MLHPLARRTDVISEEVSGDCIVYDPRRNKAHHLNSTLTWIWNRCDGQTDVESMTESFECQFGTTISTEMLISGLQQLEKCELLEGPIQLPDVASVSRRSVMAGAVLMPAVVSILAPTPAAAQSRDKDKDKDKKEKKDK
jgi:hypothetical protein